MVKIGVMEIKKNYKIGFDICGLVLFLLIMIPNFIWFTVPAPNDILRVESSTNVLDGVASIFQVIMVAALCAIINRANEKTIHKPFLYGTIISCLFYFMGWIFYYSGFTNPLIIIDLFVAPCMAFLFFALFRKNMVAIIPTMIFMICHSVHGILNYII